MRIEINILCGIANKCYKNKLGLQVYMCNTWAWQGQTKIINNKQ